MRRNFEYDSVAMSRTLQNIANDLIKLPGQVGLKPDEKFALTMMMLTRLNASIIAAQVENKKAADELVTILFDQTRDNVHRAGAILASARAMGFGSTLSWDMLTKLLEEDDGEDT